MNVKGLEGMSDEQIKSELQRGAKFVIFEYCVSILIMTFKRPSSIYFIKSSDSRVGKGFMFTVISFFFGWWGIPWGPIYTIGSFVTNFGGGKDVTAQMLESLKSE